MIVGTHDGIQVVRDDLYPGGTKARLIPTIAKGWDEVVYASPVFGGAQIALATVLGEHATIFCAKRKERYFRTQQAIGLGARVIEVAPGYLNVVQKRAKDYANSGGNKLLLDFGMKSDVAIELICTAAKRAADDVDEVWCAAGSGTLSLGLQKAFPNAEHNVVQVGRELQICGKAVIHQTKYKFEDVCRYAPPFPSDRHYDAKAWEQCVQKANRNKRVLFWNVLGWV